MLFFTRQFSEGVRPGPDPDPGPRTLEHECVHLIGYATADQINPASMSSASATIDLGSLALGDVLTTSKGATQILLSTIGGEAVI